MEQIPLQGHDGTGHEASSPGVLWLPMPSWLSIASAQPETTLYLKWKSSKCLLSPAELCAAAPHACGLITALIGISACNLSLQLFAGSGKRRKHFRGLVLIIRMPGTVARLCVCPGCVQALCVSSLCSASMCVRALCPCSGSVFRACGQALRSVSVCVQALCSGSVSRLCFHVQALCSGSVFRLCLCPGSMYVQSLCMFRHCIHVQALCASRLCVQALYVFRLCVCPGSVCVQSLCSDSASRLCVHVQALCPGSVSRLCVQTLYLGSVSVFMSRLSAQSLCPSSRSRLCVQALYPGSGSRLCIQALCPCPGSVSRLRGSPSSSRCAVPAMKQQLLTATQLLGFILAASLFGLCQGPERTSLPGEQEQAL